MSEQSRSPHSSLAAGAFGRRAFGALAGAAAVTAAVGPAAAQSQGSGAQGSGGSATGAGRAGTAGGQPFADLIQDHRQVAQMLKQLASATDPQTRQQQVKQLKTMLTAHAVAEENALYPALQTIADDEDEAESAYREHARMKVQLFEVEMAAATGKDWDDKVKTLTKTITEHVEEEESKIFPRMQQQLESAQLQQVEQQVRTNKQMVG